MDNTIIVMNKDVLREMIIKAKENKIPNGYMNVYLVLKGRYNNITMLCNPSLNTIVEDCGLSKGTVIKILEFLENEGYILVSKGDRTSSNRYFFPKDILYDVEEEFTKEYANAVHASGADWVSYYHKFVEPYRNMLVLKEKEASETFDDVLDCYGEVIPF